MLPFLVLMSFLFCHQLMATTIHGQILPSEQGEIPAKVYLRAYTQSQSFSLDSADVNTYGAYTLDKHIHSHGLYYLIIGKVRYKVFLSPDEPQIRIQNQYQNQDKIWIENSNENDAFKLFRQSVEYYESAIFEILAYYSQTDSQDFYLRPLIKGLAQNIKQIGIYTPQTYVNKTLCSIKSWASKPEVDTVINLKRMMKLNYLTSLPLDNVSLLELPIFDDTYMGYVANLMDTSIADIDSLLAIIENSDLPQKNYLYTNRQLFRFLVLSQRENQLNRFLFLQSGNIRLVDDLVLQSQMKEVAVIMPGQKTKDIKGLDIQGKPQSLYSFLEKKKITLLIFWEPSCTHCTDALPRLETLYERYGNKGFGIFSVSIADNTAEWKKYVAMQKLPWTNIQMVKNEKEKNDANYFFVVYTPTFVLIKQDGTIFHRFIDIRNLEQQIKSIL